jgi:hypothetical protein
MPGSGSTVVLDRRSLAAFRRSCRLWMGRTGFSTRAEAVDEQVDHAPGLSGPYVVGGRAEAGDRSQQVVGLDIGTDRAGGHRRVEQRLEGGFELPPEVRGQGVECRAPRVQRCGEPTFGREKV